MGKPHPVGCSRDIVTRGRATSLCHCVRSQHTCHDEFWVAGDPFHPDLGGSLSGASSRIVLAVA